MGGISTANNFSVSGDITFGNGLARFNQTTNTGEMNSRVKTLV